MAKDPFREALNKVNRAMGVGAAVEEPEAEEKPARRVKSISPMLSTLAAELRHEADDQLVRVVAHSWSVECERWSDTPREDRDANSGELLATGVEGYVNCFGPIAVGQCQPDVLGALRNAGIEGPVRLIFRSRTSEDTFPIETSLRPAPEPETPHLNPNAGMAEMMQLFMAQQEKQTAMVLAAMKQMTEKNAATEREFQRKLEEREQRYRDELRRVQDNAMATLESDKKRQLGGNMEQMAYQVMSNGMTKIFENMLNPQAAQAQPGMMPGPMAAPQSPTQSLLTIVQSMKADAEAKRLLAQELPGILGEVPKAPEPTLFEMAQQFIPVFMLLKNMNGKDPNQLENAMRQFAQMRGPAANVNPLTGLPIPDAAPADGDAAIMQLQQAMGQG